MTTKDSDDSFWFWLIIALFAVMIFGEIALYGAGIFIMYLLYQIWKEIR